jgi:hypothetical protein
VSFLAQPIASGALNLLFPNCNIK